MPTDLNGLKTFIAVAETGSIVAAARRLNATQPTISRQLQSLERELGLLLFDRVGRGIRITADGESLFQQAARVLAEANALTEQAWGMRKGQRGTLRIGATTQVIETVLSGFLGAYLPQHPEIDIHLIEDGGARLSKRLEDGDVQLAIMPADQPGYEGRLLYPMYTLAVSALSKRQPRKRIDVSELARERLLVLTPRFASRKWLEAAFSAERVSPKIVFESTSPTTLIALARAGLGVAVVPSPVALPFNKVGISVVMQRNIPIGRWASISWHPQRRLPAFAQDFIADLVEQAPQLDPGKAYTKGAPHLPRH